MQLFKDLAGEAAQLNKEYNSMHKNSQVNETHTYLPECWAGLVPLKAEYYKGRLFFFVIFIIQYNIFWEGGNNNI